MYLLECLDIHAPPWQGIGVPPPSDYVPPNAGARDPPLTHQKNLQHHDDW
jgi:hypothetical protein